MTETDADRLRQIVVRAVIPRMGEYLTLTMAQIAQAAGVSEAELSAVFVDKETVMQACTATLTQAVGAALDPREAVRKLNAIRLDQPLASRLVQVIDILDAYHRRSRLDLDAVMRASAPPADTADALGARPPDRREDLRGLGGLTEFRDAVAKVLRPDEHRLRLPADVLAGAFIGMTFDGVRAARPGRSPVPAEQIIDLFLHGALSGPPGP